MTVDTLALHLALHGAIVLLLGLIGGLYFARAIRRGRGEVAWRVVHAGGCLAGALLLALAWPIRLVGGPEVLRLALAGTLILATYLLVLGMFIAAGTAERGIPGGGSRLNRLVALLYQLGSAMALLASGLLVLGLGLALR